MKKLESDIIILKNGEWDNVPLIKVMLVLNTCVDFFKAHISSENFNTKKVYVQNHRDIDDPFVHSKLFKLTPENWIYISVEGENWIDYLHQFAHEYCHHLIESPFENENDKFGWIEEVFCELARLHVIKYTLDTWKNINVYPEFTDQIPVLEGYLNQKILNQNTKLEQPLNQWIKEHLEDLFLERYFRDKNELVAANIADLFFNNPSLWNLVPLIKNIEVLDDMKLEDFFKEWEKLIADEDKKVWYLFRNLLVCKSI